MPELPEVETTKRGIEPHILNQRIERIEVRQPRLRWPIPESISQQLDGLIIQKIQRRSKYLILSLSNGQHLLIHLGMSGSLRIIRKSPALEALRKHDHVIFYFNDCEMRYHDPRRFGAILLSENDWQAHELIRHLGPEPLEDGFSDEHLYNKSRGKTVAVKQFIMDAKHVVGVGNIYANEALFLAGIHPKRAAGKISKARYAKLSQAIRQVLSSAITQGGTTLRDFVNADNNPGYFQQTLHVYGRENQPCTRCSKPLTPLRMNNRATVFCSTCQC